MRIAICCTLCAALWRVWGPLSISSKLSKYKSTPLKLFPCLCGGCSVCKICKWIFQVEVLYHCWNILDIRPLSSNMLQSTFIKSTNRIRRSGHLQFKQTKIEMVQSCKTWWQCLLYPFLAFSTQNPEARKTCQKLLDMSWHTALSTRLCRLYRLLSHILLCGAVRNLPAARRLLLETLSMVSCGVMRSRYQDCKSKNTVP